MPEEYSLKLKLRFIEHAISVLKKGEKFLLCQLFYQWQRASKLETTVPMKVRFPELFVRITQAIARTGGALCISYKDDYVGRIRLLNNLKKQLEV